MEKIPNWLILIMLGTEAIFLLFEFLFKKDIFKQLLISSGIGFFGSFTVIFIFSVITKGGMGMGDVKLLSALGLLMGVSAVFYTFVYSMVLCFFAALFMLFFKDNKMKDVLAFGPFIYFGFLAAVIFGTF